MKSFLFIRIIGLLTLAMAWQYAYSQTDDIHFEQITVDNGLAQNDVFTILQDSQSFIWLGTLDGLVRYDGQKFTTYKHDQLRPTSLSHNSISTLFESKNGFLWIGTDRDLNQLDLQDFHASDPKKAQFIHYDERSQYKELLSIGAIYEDSAGTIWIGSNDHGLFELQNEACLSYQHDPEDPDGIRCNKINQFLEDPVDPGRILWMATHGGLLNFDLQTKTFKRFSHDPNDPGSLSHDYVEAICTDLQGNLWIGGVDTDVGCYLDEISVACDATFANPETWSEGIHNWGSEYGSWEWGEPGSGPSSAHSTPYCIGTNLNGNYQDGARSRLISVPIKISSKIDNPNLQFWHWFSFNEADFGQVQVKELGQEEWIDLENANYVATSSEVWSNTYLPLNDFSGKTIQIGFYFHSDNHGGGGVDISTGWYIDDIEVYGVVTDLNEFNSSLPRTFNLFQNYPNPFNPLTTIKYELPITSDTKLVIYNLLGQQIRALLSKKIPAGFHAIQWDGKDDLGLPVASGVYLYRLQAGDFVQTHKMLLLR